MGKREPRMGTCHLCGTYGPLTFEHIPPQSAFNDRPVVVLPFGDALELGPGEVARGPIQQKGMGAYTLCGQCNNDTGSWYARAFVEWCYRGMAILEASAGRPKLVYASDLYPLRVIKQIVTMFFTVHPPGWRLRRNHQELVRLVLNKEAKGLPRGCRVYTYYNVEGTFRSSGAIGSANILTGQTTTFAEITFPPFGYVMTFDSDPPDRRLFDITYFAFMDYDEHRPTTHDMPVLPTHLALPGDYRTKYEIDRDSLRNHALERADREAARD